MGLRLTPGTLRYRHTISMNGRENTTESTTAIEELEDGWSATESTQTNLFTLAETVILEKETLQLRKQSLSGGPVRFEIHYRDHRATGTLRISMQADQAIDSDVGGEIFGQGPAASHAIAALPLELGYTRKFRNFHPAKQTITDKQLQVVALEGNAWRIEITPGPTTLLIDRETRAVLRVATTLANGMTSTSELLPA